MFRRFSVTLILFAWACAHGWIWDAAQVLAWGKMFGGYVQEMSFQEAVKTTFDPTQPCELCVAIDQARSPQPAPDYPYPTPPNSSPKNDLKWTLTLGPNQESISGKEIPDAEFSWRMLQALSPTTQIFPVPTPPPKYPV